MRVMYNSENAFKTPQIVCPKCDSVLKQTRTVRSADNRTVTRYYKCSNLECSYHTKSKELCGAKLTVYDEDLYLEGMCNKINVEYAKHHNGKMLRHDSFLQDDFDWDDYEISIRDAMREALGMEGMLDFIALVFFWSIGRFEVMDSIPYPSSGREGSKLVHIPFEEYFSKIAKYLKVDALEKEAFPKKRSLERKP